LRLIPLIVAALVPLAIGASQIDRALDLQREGKLQESHDLLKSAAAEARASGDRPSLAKALGVAADISISLGDYARAVREATELIDVRKSLHDTRRLGDDYITLGLAEEQLADYAASIAAYQKALEVDHANGDAEGEIIALNDIGNVHYFLGSYGEALRIYQAAMDSLRAHPGETWSAARRELTIANLATLYQRLGEEPAALDLYRQLQASPSAMRPSEHARLILNQGVLFRRMGDPVKALKFYRTAQELFATDHHLDGEISALRNTGIALAVDWHDQPGALSAFTRALELSKESHNLRGEVQACLYRGEVLRRLGRGTEAAADLQSALAGARAANLREEEWKALYGLGRVAEDAGNSRQAGDLYRQAIAIMESIRENVTAVAQRTEFLADRRDVFDSLIALRLRDAAADPQELFAWMERSRARTLEDRVRPREALADPNLKTVQGRLAPDTVLLEIWTANEDGAAVWITPSSSGLVRYAGAAQLRAVSTQLQTALVQPGKEWQPLAAQLGELILAGLPHARHLIVVPDGVLATIPFEVLSTASSRAMLIEQTDVAYLPSARFAAPLAQKNWKALAPWSRQMVAWGDPPVVSQSALSERWQPLPHSADEIRQIAEILPGHVQTHLRDDARKTYLLQGAAASVPILHFSTHAMVDGENPDRSRILLARGMDGAADYLFQREVYDLDLHGVDLVTVAACDSARGQFIRGEGVQAFSQAFLAAGAASTVTSLWRVDDDATARFMAQFYFFLARGESKAEALRMAKLKFVEAGSNLAEPRNWAALVLTGDGAAPVRRAVSASSCLAGAAGVLVLLTVFIRVRATAKQKAPQTA
jgi:CHAT domain-containing protein